MLTVSRAILGGLLALVSFCAGSRAEAQVPRGWYIASCFQNAPTAPGDGGLFLVHPRTPGPATPILGLPPSLTGSGMLALTGANSVAIRRSDGALIVGGAGPAGTPIDLHVITLSGNVVATDVAISLGAETSPYGGGVTQTAILPTGDVVVGVFGIGSGPLAGASVGLVTATGSVAPIPVTGAGSLALNALCVDPATATIYLSSHNGGNSATIWSVPVIGGAATYVVTVPVNVSGLALLPSGQLLATGLLSGTWSFFTINLPSATVSVGCSPGLGALNAVAFESNTGSYAVVSGSGGIPPRSVSFVDPSCAAAVLAQAPPAGWGVPSGIDVNPAIVAFGPRTPGAVAHDWTIAPNPGGLPLVGNAWFSLTLSSGPGSPSGLWAASLAKATPFPVAGVLVNIDLAQVLLTGPLIGSPTESIPLPIPVVPSLAGVEVFFQAAYSDLTGLVATQGLSVAVL